METRRFDTVTKPSPKGDFCLHMVRILEKPFINILTTLACRWLKKNVYDNAEQPQRYALKTRQQQSCKQSWRKRALLSKRNGALCWEIADTEKEKHWTRSFNFLHICLPNPTHVYL